MALSDIDLKSIAASGASMILHADDLSSLELEGIVASPSGNQAQIIINNLRDKPPQYLEKIIALGKGKVSFEFS